MTTPAAAPATARPAQRRRPGEFGASRKFTPRRKVCQFCVDKIQEVDYKDLGRLRRFLSERGKIEPRRKTGTCAAHQRSLNVALKRARQLALLPFTAEHIRVTGVLVREPGTPPFRGMRGPRPTEAEGVAAEGAPAEGAPTEGAPEGAEGAEAAPAASAEDQGTPPSPSSPETVAESSSTQGVRETPATGPQAQEA